MNNMHMLTGISITAEKTKLLATIKANREKHVTIVAEAKAGYIKKAIEAVEGKLIELKNGKAVLLHINLGMPIDNTNVYDTIIQMLEMHTGDTINLDANQVRNLQMDQWDWSDLFYHANSVYSNSAAAMAVGESKQFIRL